MARTWMLAAAIVLVVSACSTGDAVPAETTAPPAGTTDVAGSRQPASSPVTTAAVSGSSRSLGVTLSIAVDEFDVDAQLQGDAALGGDPFGAFAVCSAHAARTGAYRVGVGSTDGAVSWTSVGTVDRVVGAGTYDAEVRVELSSGATMDAIGELTLDSGLASGSFTATTLDDVAVRGSFDCAGGETELTGAIGSLPGLVEVAVLLQRGGAERVVSIISDDPAVVQCPLRAGGSPLVVAASGDVRAGAITEVELSQTADRAILRLRVGDALYEADDASLERTADGTAGTFAATTVDGVSIDGAFDCIAP